ncbi:lysosome membrane protein 2-like isoform X2 [Portunus trituberculatus]|uniref:lysosome membrane protein 2-like isoform X2 n=1 Tax=Portunus trituberculatus TaxID=210409 RepID=UPI001E1CCA26|nr:lysosome membrane protein 2-like isoform X2 [Portunus trituberculatus]
MLPITQVKVMTGVGATLVLLCSIFIGVFPVIFNSIVDKMLVVREDSDTFEAFVTPPIPIYMQFWLFNVTNPEEIRYNGAKPVLEEVGPYTYEEVRVKYAFNWTTEGSVSYLQNKSYVFSQEMSGDLREDDLITSINVLMVSLAAKVSTLHPLLLILLEVVFLRFSEKLFIRRQVGDLLFKGYPQPLLAEITKIFGDPMENKGRFGIFYPVNNTNDKVYTVKTGADGMDDFMNIQFWNGSSSLHYWQGNGSEYCNMINGTDGSQYPPRLTRSSVLRIYTSELCRSLYLTYEKDLYHHGIPVYRYIPPREVLEDPEINHDNLCYCYPDRDSCLGAGMLNLQPCLGLPLVLSTPHFYQGDEVELAKLVGLNPTKEEHETTIDVEPRTGVAMYAAKKMQLNIPLKRYGNLPSFKNVPEVIFPILWVNESAEVDSKMAREVRNAVYIPFVVVDALCGSLIAIGALLLVVSGFRYLHIKPKYSFTALHSSTAPDNCCVKIEKPVDKIGRAADLEKL